MFTCHYTSKTKAGGINIEIVFMGSSVKIEKQ